MNKDKNELKIIETRIIITLSIIRFLCIALIFYTNIIMFEVDIYELIEISSLCMIGVLLLTVVLKMVRYGFEEHDEKEEDEK